MHVVAVAVTAGMPIFELAVPCEVFGTVRRDLVDPWYEFRLCTVEPGPTRVARGFQVETPYRAADLVAADTVIVPACANVHDAPPPALLDAVRAARARGARIAAICSGTFVLAAAGLLDGRRATTHWMHAAELARRYPEVTVDPGVLYAEDGGIFTSAGTAAGLDLYLELMRRDHGTAVANALARRIVIPPHRDGGQAQYVEMPVPAANGDGLAKVLDWALARLDQPLTIADLAGIAHVSPRTLARRFRGALGVSPLQWVLSQRIRRAQHLLEATDEPVERIATLAGFGGPANLRRHFTQAVGVSPAAYRRTFRGANGTPSPHPVSPARH
ncbi:MAG: helix-turn-helix domain-containing protein [Streptosporangiales bacterium]|nr:helix-turn-helix domain-containing protein [Streptosporangiales bacterium]